MKLYPKYEGIFVCIKSEGLENDLTLYKQYDGYYFSYNHNKYLHVYTDNDSHQLTGIDAHRFITLDKWREKQINTLLNESL